MALLSCEMSLKLEHPLRKQHYRGSVAVDAICGKGNQEILHLPVPKPLMSAENIASVRTAAPEGPFSPPWNSVELGTHSGILTLIFLK